MTDVLEVLPEFGLDSTLSGLELVHRWIELGLVSGLTGRLKVRPVFASPGIVRFQCEIDAGHANFVGLVHGGVAAALVDIAGGAAALTLLEQGQTLLTMDLAIRYLNLAPIDASVMAATATVKYRDMRKIVVEVEAQCNDKTIASGSVSVSVRQKAPKGTRHE